MLFKEGMPTYGYIQTETPKLLPDSSIHGICQFLDLLTINLSCSIRGLPDTIQRGVLFSFTVTLPQALGGI